MSGTPVLREASLGLLPPSVAWPGYDRASLVPGIVHIGPGAFFRAHAAAYVDRLLHHDPRWALSAVALYSTGVADALRPQDGLYTLAMRGAGGGYRIIGSLAELLDVRDRQAIARRLAAPTTRIISMTVTEKGYCLDGSGQLDFAHPAIALDLANRAAPSSLIGWLVHALGERRAGGHGGLTLLSCDNLAGNGHLLAGAVRSFAAAVDPDLARWIADEVRFPASMVDSITPATDDRLREEVCAATGLDDRWPIQRETFTQWVIEDDFAGERPELDAVGAIFTRDVAPFEKAKLRLLNGAHSSLAYIGLLLGHETVAGAMRDPDLASFTERLMREAIAPNVAAPAGFDLPSYIGDILARFRNPAIHHLLSQIAWDGSQKLPYRLFGTVIDARRNGRDVAMFALSVAAWLRFVMRRAETGAKLVDPLADPLRRAALGGGIEALIALPDLFPEPILADRAFLDAIRLTYARIGDTQMLRRELANAGTAHQSIRMNMGEEA